ncbi:histone-lysine N-methyltransferase SETMAR [Trichonephila clavipes]|nr:histone-lysine N-methyltransferase SETMAR [Trichonephila clavipes]
MRSVLDEVETDQTRVEPDEIIDINPNIEIKFETRTGRPQALDDEALQAAIEEDSSQTCGELARQFNTFSETIILHLHRLGKTYMLRKWVPHTLLEVHKQQRVAACLSLLSRHRSASICNRVLTSVEKWVLYDTPKRSKYLLLPQDTVPHSARPPMHPRKIMLCVWWTCRQVVQYELLPMEPTYFQCGPIFAAIGTCTTGTASEGARTD